MLLLYLYRSASGRGDTLLLFVVWSACRGKLVRAQLARAQLATPIRLPAAAAYRALLVVAGRNA